MTISQVPHVTIAADLIRESTSLLQGARDEVSAHEKVLYWAGIRSDGVWHITTCIEPELTSTWGSYQTSASANAKVIQYLAANELELLSQVHSHPGIFIDHSNGDDRGAFMPYEGFLSIVVPFYGVDGILPLTQCGVHRFQNGGFYRLSESEIDEGFSIID
jgi:proteasome lid subunit RPN8/RPN11